MGKAKEEVNGYQAEIDALQAFEQAFWKMCSSRLPTMKAVHNALSRAPSSTAALGARTAGRRK